jgi:ABC-type bacteriocin/lantibiotic exporter with double-glycine peptidase domain
MVTIIAAFVIAFIWGSWHLTIVLLGIMPILVIAVVAQMKTLRANTEKSQQSVAKVSAPREGVWSVGGGGCDVWGRVG